MNTTFAVVRRRVNRANSVFFFTAFVLGGLVASGPVVAQSSSLKLVAWPSGSLQGNVPPGLSNITAIQASINHNILRSPAWRPAVPRWSFRSPAIDSIV